MLVGLIGIGFLLFLMALGVHIAFAMAIVGFAGFVYLGGLSAGLGQMGVTPSSTIRNFLLIAVPLFILMGELASGGGLTKDLYTAGANWLGRMPCGLAMATVFGSAGFAAVSGSSIATAGTVGAIAFKEMRKFGYHARLTAGCVAAGGTLGILMPPSIPMIIYGFATEQSVVRLFFAGVVPAILSAFLYMVMLAFLPQFTPGVAPKMATVGWVEKVKSLRGIGPVVITFALTMGGLWLGFFTPTEAASVGVACVSLILIVGKKLSLATLIRSLMNASHTTAMIFTITIGAMIFSHFISISRLPAEFSGLIAGLDLNRWIILVLVMAMYFILGCFLDVFGMMLLTLPVIFPLIVVLGFDTIWFGILLMKCCEISLITPPVGMNVFVIARIAKDVPLTQIFIGILPFLIMDIITLAILMVFPQISLFLPSLMD